MPSLPEHVAEMGEIARALRRGDTDRALEVMSAVWDGDRAAARRALLVVFGVDLEAEDDDPGPSR